MKIKNIAAISLLAGLLTSCSEGMVMDPEGDAYFEEMLTLMGVVSDEDGNPINHIKVTVECDGYELVNTVYTSAKGRFYSFIDTYGKEYPIILDITIEDVDGENNGGLYETLTDRITILEDYISNGTVEATYRLTRATL